ncbi:MAG: pentapeptide repeat-containing protein [Acidobacteriota bacterium]
MSKTTGTIRVLRHGVGIGAGYLATRASDDRTVFVLETDGWDGIRSGSSLGQVDIPGGAELRPVLAKDLGVVESWVSHFPGIKVRVSHGGSRGGPPRKVEDPLSFTITAERRDIAALDALLTHGESRAGAIRQLITEEIRTRLPGAEYSDALDLSGFDLSGVDLTDADLSFANLSAADLSGAKLTSANLSGANLSGADLSAANLTDADLSDANLSGANLADANVMSVNFAGADLSDVDFTGADLTDAWKLTRADLTDAKGLEPYAIYRVPDLDAQILEAIGPEAENLDMDNWPNEDEDAHPDLAGWAVNLAGATRLAGRNGYEAAGGLIYAVSTGSVPDFDASDEGALRELRRRVKNAEIQSRWDSEED